MKKIHFAWCNEDVTEGGLARNGAFNEYLMNKGYETVNFYPSNIFKRFLNIIKMIKLLKSMDGNRVVLHGNFLITTFLFQLFTNKSYAKSISKLLRRVSERNQLIIEINDLRYEQSLDVKTKRVSQKFVDLEAEILYSHQNAIYVFASNHMRDYAVQKYNLNFLNTTVVLNGGPVLKEEFLEKTNENIVKYIYAGTLNKGRQIEEILELFKGKKNAELYLMGINGEWIAKECDYNHIKYLGALSEVDAHHIVSKCDVGLIPYNSEGLYYNMCYPTKASFYITAGIPFISTELDELKYVFENQDVIFSNMDNWTNIIDDLNIEKVTKLKSSIKEIQKKFEWGNMFSDFEVIVKRENEI